MDLRNALLVLTSDLTLLECQRAIIRLVSLGEITEAEAADNEARLRQTATYWTLLAIDRDLVERASHPFPVEPIRTLDVLHLASALVARTAVPEIALLSLDHRVRTCAHALGFQLLPA